MNPESIEGNSLSVGLGGKTTIAISCEGGGKCLPRLGQGSVLSETLAQRFGIAHPRK